VNPQTFQAQLEVAIENRDRNALSELERIAGDDPDTDMMWQDHLLIENAVQQWQQISRPSQTLLPATSPSLVPLRQRLAAATTAVVLLVTAVSFFRSPAHQQSVTMTTTIHEVAASVEELPQHNTAVQDDQLFVRNESAPAFSSTTGIQDLHLPVSVVSNMHAQLSEEVYQAWSLISRLPDDAVQVYEQLEGIVPKTAPVTLPAPEETEEQDFLPASIRSLLS